ncbi:HAD family hydrolase [Oerskovia sp. M15]
MTTTDLPRSRPRRACRGAHRRRPLDARDGPALDARPELAPRRAAPRLRRRHLPDDQAPRGLRGARRPPERRPRARGHRYAPEVLEPVLRGGVSALKDWKNASSRRLEPLELDHRTIWHDFLASPLPLSAREVLAGSASTLLARVTATLSEHTVRPGIPELLATAADLRIRVGIVSNAHSGRAHRTLLAAHGLDEAFGVQVYSDEVGIRKPHPGIIALAARALGTTPTGPGTSATPSTGTSSQVDGRRRRRDPDSPPPQRHPPYPVTDTADAVLDTPRASGTCCGPRAPSRPPGLPRSPRHRHPPCGRDTAVSLSSPPGSRRGHRDVRTRRRGAPRVRPSPRAAARRRGYVLSPEEAAEAVAGRACGTARGRTGTRGDRGGLARRPAAGVVEEIDPTTFWVELVGPALAHLGDGIGDWLRAEAYALVLEYARSKSLPTLRPGVREVLEAARAGGVPVAVVSNTVCGRAVREELEDFGIDHLVGVHVYSDELGRRKPDP